MFMEAIKIEGFNYGIFSNGDVKNIKTGRILKRHLNQDGYIKVIIFRNGVRYEILVHQQVIKYFGPPKPSKKHTPNHKDGNKLNNTIENLEWATPSEQMIHTFRIGLSVGHIGETHKLAKLTEEKVLEIRQIWDAWKGKKGTKKLLKVKLSEKFGITPKSIEHIVYRDRWTHI